MASQRKLLEAVIETEAKTLLNIIHSYVLRMGLTTEPAQSAAIADFLAQAEHNPQLTQMLLDYHAQEQNLDKKNV